MGLLSSLFGDKKPDNSVLGALAELVDSAVDAAKTAASGNAAESSAPAPAAAAPAGQAECPAPSGDSWGEEMPAEENQFSFAGTYGAYFMKVYTESFPMYRIVYRDVRDGRAGVITFYEAEKPVLIVELLGQSSAARKLRRDCAEKGLPYLRFYYDHDGWWNTRSYVVQRTRAALGQ